MTDKKDGQPKSEFLLRQLEQTRFERGLQVAESLALHKALLTTAELARLNTILYGKKPEEDPWRQEPVTLTLASGATKTLTLIADPKQTAREKLHRATEVAQGGKPLEATLNLYVGLVLAHVFKDANRRTAALAAHYFFKRYGVPISGLALHGIAVGDLREEGQIEALRASVNQILLFVTKKK